MALEMNVSRRSGYDVVTWTEVATGATAPAYRVREGLQHIAGQAFGTFGGATLVMQGSNNASNYVGLNDLSGSAVSLTAAGGFTIGDGYRDIRPSASGGTGDDIDVVVTFRYGV